MVIQNSNKKTDYCVFIGKFAPFHNGHLKIIEMALKEADYVIVVIGSANVSPNTRIPFSLNFRYRAIRDSIPSEIADRVIVTDSSDYLYNDVKWNAEIQRSVGDAIADHQKKKPSYTNKGFKDYNNTIALVGMNKDDTSYYLNNFPQWKKSIDVGPYLFHNEVVSSTDVRKKLFNGELDYCQAILPAAVYDSLKLSIENEKEFWDKRFADYKYEMKYEATYGKGPHVTVDACVVQAGHILLVTRGREYGFGQLALPGGFLNRREKIEDGMIRELREETKIKVPEKVLRGSITSRRVFDDPYRSNRSHIITHAFKIELQNVPDGLPKVIGSDDAFKAEWFPISVLPDMENMFFEDHAHIINSLLG